MLTVSQWPEALNQTNNTLHNGHLQRKQFGLKGLLHDTAVPSATKTNEEAVERQRRRSEMCVCFVWFRLFACLGFCWWW